MATIVRSGKKWKAIVRRAALGVPLKVRTFEHKSDAEAWGRKTESEIERGLWHDNAAAETTTLEEALDRYESDVLPRKRGLRGERSILGILRDERESKLPLARFSSKHAAAMRDRWAVAGLKPGSIHRRFHTLSHVFTVAAAEWDMPALANPVRGLRLAPEDDARERRVSDQELAAIAKAGAETKHLPAFITLAVETAMRREELINVKVRDLDLRAGVLHVPKSKNGSPRDVPLTPVASKLLGALVPAKAPPARRVFEWKRADSATQAFVRAVRRARKHYVADCKAKDIEPSETFLVDLRLHDLRHEAMSRLSDQYGFGPHELAKIAGQKTLRMVMRYYHPRAEDFAKRMRAKRA